MVHVGNAFSGHFMTYRRGPSKPNEPLNTHWLCVSDETVYTAQISDVLSQKAYMLYYQREWGQTPVVLWSVLQGHGFKSHAGAFRTSHLMTKLQGLDAVVEVHLHRMPMEIKFKVSGDCCMETVWQSFVYPSLQVIDSNPMLELCRMSCLRTCLSGLDVFVDQSISSSLKPVQTWWRLVKADHRYITTGLIWSARSRRRKPLKSCNIITDVLFWVYYACKL